MQSDANPYDPPTSEVLDTGLFKSRQARGVRLWLYLHLLGFTCAVVLTSFDTGFVSIDSTIRSWIQWLLAPCVASLVVCPLVVFYLVASTRLTTMQRVAIIVAELLIGVAHLGALLPMVQ